MSLETCADGREHKQTFVRDLKLYRMYLRKVEYDTSPLFVISNGFALARRVDMFLS